jgi:hypothetical protein
MTNCAMVYNIYEKSEILDGLELLYNKINKQMLGCKRSIAKVSKKLKKCPSIKSREVHVNRTSKLQNYMDKCKDVNTELNSIIAWADTEYIRTENNRISLRLYNAIYNVIQKINKHFPRLNYITLDVLKHANEQVCGSCYESVPEQDDSYDSYDTDDSYDSYDFVDLWQTQEFQQERVVDLFG